MTAEGGAMIAMTPNVALETSTVSRNRGGILAAVKRLVAGESFFLNHFKAGNLRGEVYLGAALPGEMVAVDLSGLALIVQAGSFVACESTVGMDASWQGFQTLLSGESLFWLRMTGHGKVVLNSYGAIYPIEVDGEYIVDTGHIVAFEESLKFSISKAGGSWLHSFLGGEGMVCRFSGKGTVWCQSHNFSTLGGAIGPSLKPL
jgi:uncharacterized protein (TIGR00266 family)